MVVVVGGWLVGVAVGVGVGGVGGLAVVVL